MFRSAHRIVPVIMVALCVLGCSPSEEVKDGKEKKAEVSCDIGEVDGLEATIVLSELRNPSSVSFDSKGRLTVCDSGHGRVLMYKDGKTKEWITDFVTEHWKVDQDSGAKRYQLGPLSALWMGETLVVTDGGPGDGAETLAFFKKAGKASSGERSAPVKSLESDEKMAGEGNLIGMSYDAKSGEIYICGHGDDTKTWLLRYSTKSKKLEKWASADDNGIATNSPMQTMIEDDGHILVLYSGAGGQDDGLLVRWDRKTAKPVTQWTLKGLVDPMGMARIPGSKDFAIVDNNWALTEVKEGRLARVSLPEGGGAAQIDVLATKLHGPVSCTFGPDGRLYIAQLGSEFDKEQGQVLAVDGL